MSRQGGTGRGRIAFVKDQINHLQHRAQTRGQFRGDRYLIGNVRLANLGLGAHDALGQGAGRGEKGTGNFFRGKAAYLTQGQGELGLGREAGVTADKDQTQTIVLNRGFVLVRLDGLRLQLFQHIIQGNIKARAPAYLVYGA